MTLAEIPPLEECTRILFFRNWLGKRREARRPLRPIAGLRLLLVVLAVGALFQIKLVSAAPAMPFVPEISLNGSSLSCIFRK